MQDLTPCNRRRRPRGLLRLLPPTAATRGNPGGCRRPPWVPLWLLRRILQLLDAPSERVALVRVRPVLGLKRRHAHLLTLGLAGRGRVERRVLLVFGEIARHHRDAFAEGVRPVRILAVLGLERLWVVRTLGLAGLRGVLRVRRRRLG